MTLVMEKAFRQSCRAPNDLLDVKILRHIMASYRILRKSTKFYNISEISTTWTTHKKSAVLPASLMTLLLMENVVFCW